jgi:hypothetical protein
VIQRNHAAAFADVFPDIDRTLRQLRFVARIRNEWAHVPPEGLVSETTTRAIETMTGLLASLNCREALEVDDLKKRQPSEIAQAMGDAPANEAEPLNDEESIDIPTGLWHELQRYLALDFSVVDTADDSSNKTQVTVRVSNVAPVGEGRPEVQFQTVNLTVMSAGNQRSTNLGALAPGQAVEREFNFHPKQLASVAFEVTGSVDFARLFRFHRSRGLPTSVVNPLLQEFAQRFADIQIDEPLNMALDAVRSVGPEMTLADARRVRQDLEQTNLLIVEKEAALQSLFRDYHLNKQTRLGAHCHEVWQLFREVGIRIQAVDSAIGGTDPDAATQAVTSLEELKLAVLQLEETTRSMSA